MRRGDRPSRVAHRLRGGTQVIVRPRRLVRRWPRARPRSRLAPWVYAIPYTNLAGVVRGTGLAGRVHCASSNSRLSLGTQSPG